MRKLTAALLTALTVSSFSVWAAEPEAQPEGIPYTLHTEGKTDRTVQVGLVVPLRDVAEHVGLIVEWSADGTIVKNDSVETKVVLGKDEYTITREGDMAYTVSLGAAPYLRHNVTYVPVDLFYELLGDEAGQIAIDGNTLIIGPLPSEEIDKKSTVKEKAKEKAKETKEKAEKKTAERIGVKGEDVELAETAAAAASAAADEAEEVTAIGMPNPFHDYTTLSEAEEAAGYTLTLPEDTEEYTDVSYRAIPKDLLEVIYEKDGSEALRIRKGADKSDVSGDYSTYKTVKTISVDGTRVRMKGNSTNRMSLATWQKDGHAYALSTKKPKTLAQMIELVRAIQ